MHSSKSFANPSHFIKPGFMKWEGFAKLFEGSMLFENATAYGCLAPYACLILKMRYLCATFFTALPKPWRTCIENFAENTFPGGWPPLVEITQFTKHPAPEELKICTFLQPWPVYPARVLPFFTHRFLDHMLCASLLRWIESSIGGFSVIEY